ncbi:hypothetical protein NG54_05515 [Heyndrickxia ginsengihumi]|uniref:Voltage-dependent anion channel n=1 Tax=Heyndrickxia ginsengihumi TaxID=363870 RepID=A0A0A6VHH2_9BACI|nr:hypothetical protein [Heyndrickxia ginsengihumi]KHD86074.1 hypothetical protein NG54_05515 [Heyndrickxia ginsengihumi]
MVFWILSVCFFLYYISFIQRKLKPVIPATYGAVVMALGILICGVIHRLGIANDLIGWLLTACLLSILFFLIIVYIGDLVTRDFYHFHLKDPVHSFAIGTLVAGTSITIITIKTELARLVMFTYFLYIIACFLWIIYIMLAIRNYLLFFKKVDLMRNAHGILLLTCVSTQSLVIAGNVIFSTDFPKVLSEVLITAGMILYLYNVTIIIMRVIKINLFSLDKEWQNTNCIIHGAVSITGLAMLMSRSFSSMFVYFIWILTCFLFLLVESAEILRAIQRIGRYGWRNGIACYQPSQWVRNFTFGMFFTFTAQISFDTPFIIVMKQYFVKIGIGFVLFLFLFEMSLFMTQFIRMQTKNTMKDHNISL